MNYIILLSGLFLLSFTVQQNPIHKRWNLVAEETTYYNLDYTRYTPTRDRLDSITGETVEFLANGSFISPDGNGTYTTSKDSIHLTINGQKRSFRYSLRDSKLIMQQDLRESRFIIRSTLHME